MWKGLLKAFLSEPGVWWWPSLSGKADFEGVGDGKKCWVGFLARPGSVSAGGFGGISHPDVDGQGDVVVWGTVMRQVSSFLELLDWWTVVRQTSSF